MSKTNYKPIARNRRAKYDYDISSNLIAGLVLTGAETKSVRNGSVSLKGSFANFKDGELWVNNMHISQYPFATYDKPYDPAQPRKLLVSKSELARLAADKQNGKHIVVQSLGISGRFIKLELGIGNSKKRHDKRQQIKARSQQRESDKAAARANKS